MSAAALLTAYVVVLLTALAAVGIHGDYRRKRFEPTPSQDSLFRCEACSLVYTDDPDVVRSRCPQCGQLNNSFRF